MHQPVVTSLRDLLHRSRATTCRCGHTDLAHEHYRRGDDCARCACPSFHGARAAAAPSPAALRASA